MIRPTRSAILLTMTLVSAAASAQTITGIKIEPAQAQPGAPVKITVLAEPGGGVVNCGLKMHFGDGQTADFKITDAKMLPLVVEHSYAKAGSYNVMAEPKKVTTHFKCGGDNQRGVVSVAAPVMASAAAAAPAPATTQCPQGWTLAAKSVNKKSGAFTCTAKPGTAAPAARLGCPGDLSYFENVKKGQLGCRP
jgi:hypothetical protein